MSILGCFADQNIKRIFSGIFTPICLFTATGVPLGFLSCQTSALAQDQAGSVPQSSPVPKFSLQVSKEELRLLNQQASQGASGGVNANGGPGNPYSIAAVPILPQSAALPTAPAMAPAMRQAPIDPSKLRSMQAVPEKPNSYLTEYNVAWAPWIAALASVWYNNLRFHEASYGAQFHTLRPALIQFTCYADGHIGNVVLRQSSGIPVYDQLQVVALLQAAPLAPFPKGTAKSNITLVQGWESHRKRPGESDFQPFNFAGRYPQEKVIRYAGTQ